MSKAPPKPPAVTAVSVADVSTSERAAGVLSSLYTRSIDGVSRIHNKLCTELQQKLGVTPQQSNAILLASLAVVVAGVAYTVKTRSSSKHADASSEDDKNSARNKHPHPVAVELLTYVTDVLASATDETITELFVYLASRTRSPPPAAAARLLSHISGAQIPSLHTVLGLSTDIHRSSILPRSVCGIARCRCGAVHVDLEDLSDPLQGMLWPRLAHGRPMIMIQPHHVSISESSLRKCLRTQIPVAAAALPPQPAQATHVVHHIVALSCQECTETPLYLLDFAPISPASTENRKVYAVHMSALTQLKALYASDGDASSKTVTVPVQVYPFAGYAGDASSSSASWKRRDLMDIAVVAEARAATRIAHKTKTRKQAKHTRHRHRSSASNAEIVYSTPAAMPALVTHSPSVPPAPQSALAREPSPYSVGSSISSRRTNFSGDNSSFASFGMPSTQLIDVVPGRNKRTVRISTGESSTTDEGRSSTANYYGYLPGSLAGSGAGRADDTVDASSARKQNSRYLTAGVVSAESFEGTLEIKRDTEVHAMVPAVPVHAAAKASSLSASVDVSNIDRGHPHELLAQNLSAPPRRLKDKPHAAHSVITAHVPLSSEAPAQFRADGEAGGTGAGPLLTHSHASVAAEADKLIQQTISKGPAASRLTYSFAATHDSAPNISPASEVTTVSLISSTTVVERTERKSTMKRRTAATLEVAGDPDD